MPLYCLTHLLMHVEPNNIFHLHDCGSDCDESVSTTNKCLFKINTRYIDRLHRSRKHTDDISIASIESEPYNPYRHIVHFRSGYVKHRIKQYYLNKWHYILVHNDYYYYYYDYYCYYWYCYSVCCLLAGPWTYGRYLSSIKKTVVSTFSIFNFSL